MDDEQRTERTDEEPDTWVPGQSGTARVHSPASDHATRPAPDDPPTEEPPGQPQPPEDDQRVDDTRVYVVLEEADLGSLVATVLHDAGESLTEAQSDALRGLDVYQPAGQVDARNTEHALRMVAKARYRADGVTTLVPVALRSWKPTPVTTHADTKVSVG
jgi:hypothetical protein